MKKKKRMKIILGIVIILAITIGGWLMMKPGRLKAEEKNTVKQIAPISNSLDPATEGFAFLGEGDGLFGSGEGTRWKNVTDGDMIPYNYAFEVSMLKGAPLDSNYVMEVSNGISDMANDFGYEVYPYQPAGTPSIKAAPGRHISGSDQFDKVSIAFPTVTRNPQWIKIANVGYYDGEKIGVKVTVIPDKVQSQNYRTNWIGWNSVQFLETLVMREAGGLEISFEFFHMSKPDEMIPITGNWPIMFRYPESVVTVSSPKASEIKNFYSVSRDNESSPGVSAPIDVLYKLNGENIVLKPNSSDYTGMDYSTRETVVMTFEKQSKIQYHLESTLNPVSGYFSTMYNFKPPVASEVPAPESGEDRVVSQISSATQDNLYLEFNQLIPFEPANFRSRQRLKWIIEQQETAPQVTYQSDLTNTQWSNGWGMINNQGVNKLTDFTNLVSGTNAGDAVIDLKDKTTEFYQEGNNYLFKQKLKMDYSSSIDPDKLRKLKAPADKSGYYLPKTSQVTLSGMLRPPGEPTSVSTDYTTWINFAANVEYQRYELAPGKTAPDGTETLIDKINTADNDALKTLGIDDQPLITLDPPIPTANITVDSITYIPALGTDSNQLVTYSIPKADGTDSTGNTQLQLTGAAEGETGDKNIVKLYYRSLAYDVDLKVVSSDNETTLKEGTDARSLFTIKDSTNPGISVNQLVAGDKVHIIV